MRRRANLHHLYENFLAHTKHSNLMAAKYFEVFSERLALYPLGEWTELRLMEMLKVDMVECAVVALFGKQILKMNPEFVDIYWELDEVIGELAFGLPRAVNPRPYKSRDKFHAMMGKYVESAWDHYDWDAPGAEDADWDEHFGARLNREMAKWLKVNFCMQTNAGSFATLVLGYVNCKQPV